ncbi:MAG: outer spore coat protein CotE [Bacilli bacterium]
MLRDIIVKTLVGKGKCQNVDKLTLKLPEVASKTLGCWIINNTYETSYKGEEVFIKGKYDVQLWYAINDDKKTNVYYKTIPYESSFVMSWRNLKKVNDEMFLKVYVIKYPTPIFMELKNETEVELKIESSYVVESYKDAVITVESKNEENDDSEIIDDLIMNINPNYIENKE